MKLVDKLKLGLAGLAFLAGTSWIFGGEPVIFGPAPNEYVQNFGFREYQEAIRENNGDSAHIKVLTYIAYPGAKLGRHIHNAMIDDS